MTHKKGEHFKLKFLNNWATVGVLLRGLESLGNLIILLEGRVSDSIRPVDPDQESGSGSRRAKMTHKSRKKFKNFLF
jgi:hypothetical protein